MRTLARFRLSRPDAGGRPVRRSVVVAAAALSLGLPLAACGGGSPTSGAASGAASSGGGSHTAGLLAYSRCMRSHGVANFPDPGGKGGIPKSEVLSAFQGVSTAVARRAEQACRTLLPPGGSLGGQPTQTITPKDQQDYLEAAACMRSHGFPTFPDPTFSGGTVTLHKPSTIDTGSARFEAAAHLCEKLVPRGLPYSGSGG